MLNVRRPAAIALALWTTNLLFVIAGDTLMMLNWSSDVERDPFLVGLGYLLVFLLFASVGALIMWLRPENPVGWCLFGLGALSSLIGFASEYGVYGLATNPGAVPIPEVAAWIYNTGSNLFVLFIPLIFLLFPSGRLLSSRWRWFVWIVGLSFVASVFWNFNTGTLNNFEIETDNPFGFLASTQLTNAFGSLSLLLEFIGIIGGLVSLVVRFRRARGVERQQFKWLAMSAVVMVIVALSAPLLWAVASAVWSVVFVVGISTIPIGIGIAILRHNLYDIDRIINRTLVYTILTAILVGADLLLVFAIERLFQPVASGSDLVVAGSTLAVAAFIRPVRGRIQSGVDRRFYRHKYDATRTLEAFSARLRDEVDLAALTSELQATVKETMHPEHVSLWLLRTEAR